MIAKTKGRNGGDRATLNTTDNEKHTRNLYWCKVECAILGAAYWLEESSQRYAERRQLLRQAATCLVLAFLGSLGVRYV